MLAYQLLTILVFSGLILLGILAFIEPGPLNRRSRNRHGQRPADAPDKTTDQQD